MLNVNLITEPECQGNMLHGCAIHDTNIKPHTLVPYIACMMNSRERQDVGARKVAKHTDI